MLLVLYLETHPQSQGYVDFLLIFSSSKFWKHPAQPRFPVKSTLWAFPGGSVVKAPPCSAKDTGSIPSLGRSLMPQRLSRWATSNEPKLWGP